MTVSHREAYFWLGASADAETGSHASHEARPDLRPSGFDPARVCELCHLRICFTNQRMFCGCRTVPWAVEEEEE